LTIAIIIMKIMMSCSPESGTEKRWKWRKERKWREAGLKTVDSENVSCQLIG
jgi:hypothetical protein